MASRPVGSPPGPPVPATTAPVRDPGTALGLDPGHDRGAEPRPGGALDETGYADGLSAAVAAGLFAVVALAPLVPWLLRIEAYHAVLAGLHAVLCGIGVGIAVHHRFRPCLLVASVFPYCWLVLPSVFQIDHVMAAWNDPGVTLDFAATLRAQVALVLGQAAFLLGYALLRRRATTARAWEIAPDRRRRMMWISALYLVAAVVLLPLFLSAVGGPGALLSSREEVGEAFTDNGLGRDANVLGSLIKIAPSSFAIAAAVLALWLVPSAPRGSRARSGAIVLALGAIGLLIVVANPIVTPRYLVLAAFGTVALALFRPRGRLGGLLWLGLSLGALLLAYPAASYFRYGEARSGAEPVLASNDFDGFQQMINTITYVDSHGLDWGLHLLSAVFFFVPRGLWAAKTQPSTFDIADARGYDFLDLSTPLPAEAFLGFGWIGVVVLLGLVGLAWAVLDRAWISQTRLAVLAAYLAVAQVGIWRGPLGSLSGIFGFTIALLLLATVVTARRRGAAGRGDPVPSLTPPSGDRGSSDSRRERA